MWTRQTLRSAATLSLLIGAGCSDDPTRPDNGNPPAPALDGLIVSNPIESIGASVPGSSFAPEPVYMSLRPGTVTQGDRIDFTNQRTGVTVGTQLVDGGLDPFAIEAVAGDTIAVQLSGGGLPAGARYATVVPRRRPPVIVRTTPPKGKRDVPLSVALLVVMSEPIDPSSVTATTVTLTRNGTAVAGTVEVVDAQGMSLAFVPAEPLMPGAEHELRLSQQLADLGGEHLEHVAIVDFRTASAAAPHSPASPAPLPAPPPPVPTEDPILGVFERVTPWPLGNVTGSRIVLRTGGHFEFEYDHSNAGRYSLPGRFGRTGDTLDLIFDSWSLPGPWTARVTMAGDSLHVKFGIIALLDDFEDGTYVLDPGQSPRPRPSGRVAFTHLRDGVEYVSVANADRTGGTELVVGSQPAWSPDGTHLAFVRTTGAAGLPTIHTVRVDGTGEVQIGSGRHPSWSPDGRQIAFSQDTAIAVMQANGTATTILVRLSTPEIPAGTTHLDGPVWSPDGSTIAFESRIGNSTATQGSRDVHLVSTSGGIPVRLSNDGWSKSNPAWSPDGMRLAVASYDPLSSGFADALLAEYTVVTGTREILYRPTGAWPDFLDAAMSPDWRHVAFTAPGGPGSVLVILELSTGIISQFSTDIWRQHSWGTSSFEAAWGP